MAMLAVPTSTTPTAPIHTSSPSNFLSLASSLTFTIGFVPSLCLSLVNLCLKSYFIPSPTLVKVALSSRFKVGSSSTTVPNPTSEGAAIFIRFDQLETNDLDLLDFWGARALYVEFHGF